MGQRKLRSTQDITILPSSLVLWLEHTKTHTRDQLILEGFWTVKWTRSCLRQGPINETEKRENRVHFEAVTLQNLAQVLEILIVVAVIALIKDTAETQQSWPGRMATSETEPKKGPLWHKAERNGKGLGKGR